MTGDDNGVEGLVKAAKSRLDARDPLSARGLLEQARMARPGDLNVLMFLTLTCRMLGDHLAALNAIEAALTVDPFSYVVHLSKGAVIEEMGQSHAATESYRTALGLAPPMSKIPPSLQASLAHAEEAVKRDAERLRDFLIDSIAAEYARHSPESLRRFDECLTLFAGLGRRYVHEASMLYFPQLPAIPFYDEALFPWLPRLEQATDRIREEFLVVMKEDWGAFHPYIQYPEGAPLRQWKELNHSAAWSAFDLWRDGIKNEANCLRCPNTAALLDTLPMAVQQGYGPTAMFSVLAPHAHIPPHTGSTNLRLIVHLPIILPPRCRYRVGNENREWKLAKAWVFDDTIEHEAWNDSDETRVLLMFDVWNPLISEAERALVAAMMLAKHQFR